MESTTSCTDFCEWYGGSAGLSGQTAHSGVSNFLSADGHVKAGKWGATMSTRNR